MRVNEYGEFVAEERAGAIRLREGDAPPEARLIGNLLALGKLRTCDVCGKPMVPTGRGGPRKYCSFACKQEANRYRARMRYRRSRS